MNPSEVDVPELALLDARLVGMPALERVALLERVVRWASARSAQAVDDVPKLPGSTKPVAIGLEPVLGVTAGEAARRSREARVLAGTPAVRDALAAGAITPAAARQMAEAFQGLPPDLVEDGTAAVIDTVTRRDGPGAPATAFGQAARALSDRHAPDAAAERRAKAYAARRVWLTALPDDMVQIGAVIPALDGRRVLDRIDEAAARRRTAPGSTSGRKDRRGTTSTAPTPSSDSC